MGWWKQFPPHLWTLLRLPTLWALSIIVVMGVLSQRDWVGPSFLLKNYFQKFALSLRKIMLLKILPYTTSILANSRKQYTPIFANVNDLSNNSKFCANLRTFWLIYKFVLRILFLLAKFGKDFLFCVVLVNFKLFLVNISEMLWKILKVLTSIYFSKDNLSSVLKA